MGGLSIYVVGVLGVVLSVRFVVHCNCGCIG